MVTRLPPLLLLLVVLLAALPAKAQYDDRFWKHWSDGTAEIATYDTIQQRYGEPRDGLAVTIFVTEPFSLSDRVKADPGKHPEDDVVQVLKLNLVEDFPTGIYDYNLMTSTFVGLAEKGGFAPGTAAKISFSSQEWCGHMYSQVLPSSDGEARHVVHSYFDGEADSDERLTLPAEWVSEDALLHWARGLARPWLAPGESRTVPLLTSTKESRLQHVPMRVVSAELSVGRGTSTIEVPAGKFLVREKHVTRNDGVDWKFWVEEEFPHRLVAWERVGDVRAEFVAAERLPYWEQKSKQSLSLLQKLKLRPRPSRTP